MQTRLPMALGLATLLLTATACSGGTATPAPVRNYGPEAGVASSTTGGAGAPTARPAYMPPPSAPAGGATAGAIRWHTRLTDAQAEARASGKMILVTSTKPRCSLCDKFKNQIAPAAGGELNRVAVGYIYDITRPEVRQVDRLLRANLRGADLMPLVGFVTAELGWIHGFWGQRSVQQFRGDIARALSINPVRTAAVAMPSRVQAPRTAAVSNYSVVNEYGEREWSAPGDVWPAGEPEPIDAITGEPQVPSAPRMGSPAGTGAPGRMLADATPTAPVPSAPAAPAAPANPAPFGPITAPPALRVIADAPAPSAEPSIRDVIDTPAARADPTAAAGSEAWSRRELEQALRQIRAGEFDRARVTLTQVRDQATDSTLVREAGKGGIALYNAKRIRFATSGGERSRYLARARRDFGNSMWAPLFNS